MTNIVDLSGPRHGHLCLSPEPTGADQNLALLGLSEIPLAVTDYPICFAKDRTTGAFDVVVLLGFADRRNVFWRNGQWRAIYVPESIVVAPFRLSPGSAIGLAVDEDNPRLGTSGHRLFDDAGAPTVVATTMRDRLQHLVADVAAARSMATRFADLALIRPLVLAVRRDGRPPHDVEGLYSLDGNALAGLSDEQVVALFRTGHLAAASLIVASLGQLERLRQLEERQGDGSALTLDARLA
ncbi:hypothetical protein EAH87_16725 [Sphingomonas koreensis]|nr:hypothetical protein EAH87_16725 [Sphingomonas koreensis]